MIHPSRAAQRGASPFTYFLSVLAAIALVFASAGYGSYFAWSANRHHAEVLAVCAVVMALGLEVAKPLAVHALFDAVRSYRFGQAAALAVLATVAVSYSVAAELQLMARSRSDAVSERKRDSTAAADARTKRDALQRDLDKISSARSVAELKPLLAAKTAATKGADCTNWVEHAGIRAACLELAQLNAEAARASQRATLVAKIDAAETAMHGEHSERVSDPSAVALATYLGALGLNVSPNALGDWLVLVAVFALELGSMFSLALVQACRPNAHADENASVRLCTADEHLDRTPAEHARTPVNVGLPAVANTSTETLTECVSATPDRLTVPDDPAERLVGLLRERGGELFGSQRTIGQALGVSASRANTVMHALAEGGQLLIEPSTRGTRLRLAPVN